MAKGFIYIMTNPALKGMVKIGYASDVEARRKQLSTTALPYDYEVFVMKSLPHTKHPGIWKTKNCIK